MSEVLFGVRDLVGQVPNLPADMALLIGVNGAQLIQLADLCIDLDLFKQSRGEAAANAFRRCRSEWARASSAFRLLPTMPTTVPNFFS